MKRPKRLTREESRAHTRELVLEAAEEVFLTNGFYRTTIAQIATNAGRTAGSIYANFTSKEALCLAVLERHYGQSFSELAALMGEAGDDLDSQLDAFGRWWRILNANQALTVLVVEYALAARQNSEQLVQLTAFWAVLRQLFRSILADAAHTEVAEEHVDRDLDHALTAIGSTAIGVAVGHAGAFVDTDTSVSVLTDTIRHWMNVVSSPGG